MGVRRFAFRELVLELSAAELNRRGLVPVGRFVREALAARVTSEALARGELTYLGPVAGFPGFPRALTATFEELRLNAIDPEHLRDCGESGPDLARPARGLHPRADRTPVRRPCGARQPGARSALLGLQPIAQNGGRRARSGAAHAAGARAARLGDGRRARRAGIAPGTRRRGTRLLPRLPAAISLFERRGPGTRGRWQRGHLLHFRRSAGVRGDRPRHPRRGGRGRPFRRDRHPVALRRSVTSRWSWRLCGAPGSPRTARWQPAGPTWRGALCSRCSIARWKGSPPRASPSISRWDRCPRRRTSRATPALWERLLVDAAVIGGLSRWETRLAGLREEFHRDYAAEEDEEARRHLARRIEAVENLTRLALPAIARLAALPTRAVWGEWIAALSSLAEFALREPSNVLALLERAGADGGDRSGLAGRGSAGVGSAAEFATAAAPKSRDSARSGWAASKRRAGWRSAASSSPA